MAKRKIKSSYSPRKAAIKEPYDRVLIVCEGKETEINYFNGLIRHLKLSTVNIKVQDIKQTTPDSLLKEAKKLYQEAKKSGNPYDKVYCVFDKDRHTKYQETKNQIDQIKQPKGVYCYAFSEPCFEFWLLLHYYKTTKPFTCFDKLRKDKEFKKYFPEYGKSEDIFPILQDKLAVACNNAKGNPHTNINKLVEYLQNIKKR
ncbi:MAG: RloB family protein [Gammaproteobacteria bacterium]|nr:RloB family protein [Gammaproteobacteria bacterium]